MSCHTMATPKKCVTAIISVVDWNARSALVSERKECHCNVWQLRCKCNLLSLPRVESHATKLVTVHVMDIRGWERMGKSTYVGQR